MGGLDEEATCFGDQCNACYTTFWNAWWTCQYDYCGIYPIPPACNTCDQQALDSLSTCLAGVPSDQYDTMIHYYREFHRVLVLPR